MGKKNKTRARSPDAFERMYPTRLARDVADRAVDLVPIDAPLKEHIRVWELAYIEAGGRVNA